MSDFEIFGLTVQLQSPASKALLGLACGAAFVGLWLALRRLGARPLPGKLKSKGSFELEDPVNSSAISERKRDFMRIVATQRDLWILTSTERRVGSVLPVEVFKRDGCSEEVTYNRIKFWLQGELGKIPGAVDLGATSQWEVVDRVVYFISTTPGFELAMRNKVQPCLLQPKYLLMVSKTGQVRAAWYAFCSDKVVPGETAGPFVMKLVTEDLRASREGRTHTEHVYTAKATSEKDMERLIGKHLSLILKGIDTDNWQPYLSA